MMKERQLEWICETLSTVPQRVGRYLDTPRALSEGKLGVFIILVFNAVYIYDNGYAYHW